MQPFELVRPQSVEEACATFLAAENGRYLAGGMSLIPAMKLGLATPETLIDLSSIRGLSGIVRTDDKIEIGALTRHCEVAASELVRATTPGLAILAGGIGDRQVRNRGTIGGSISNNDPAACYPSAVLGLDATLKTNIRRLPASEFFQGMFETTLEQGAILTSIQFEIPKASHYVKFQQKASRFALVGVFVSIARDRRWRIAVTGAASHAFRVKEFEAIMNSGGTPNDFSDYNSPPLNSDMHGTSDYRGHLVRVIAGRAVSHLSSHLPKEN
jgi:carbon-monoxide dehydrogenase medium subunit